MSKPFIVLLCLLFCLATQQTLKPLLLLPTETTQNVAVDYAFRFSTDTNIPHSASIMITFPFEYDPRELIRYTGCFFAFGTANLQQMPCSLRLRTFSISIGQIISGQLTVLIKNIRNPIEASMSSQFSVKTMFRDVTITESLEFGKLPFTKATIISTTTGQVFNFENNLIEQGSTWVFRFALAGSYGQNSTIRFVFPEGFTSNKVQCNITGIVDSTLQTRVFPQRNIFECMNVKASLSGNQNIILSGVVNPNFEMQMQGLQVQIIQPNNLVVLEKISITNQPQIKAKRMNATVTIPNNFRNNSITYIFEINMDSTLEAGDYMELNFGGNWTFFLQDSRIIEGVQSSPTNKARLEALYEWPTFSRVSFRNFSSISKQSQLAFYLSLRTPIQSSLYNLTITAFRANGKIVQFFTRNIEINQTTGYIRQMKLHPMNQAIKLPVGEAGPLEITLALRNNLPKTNVLTYGKIVIDITPHIPYPDVTKNGVHKCYFYGDIPAKNCTYDVDTNANPTVTHIVAFTPVDFNFESSEIPFMVTTEGFQTDDDEGLTIDTLVKRYHFHIQFYTDYSPDIPTEVIFTEWVADAKPVDELSCNQAARQGEQWNHLKCTFTTPNQVLNNAGHIHIIRFEFTNSGWFPSLGYTADTLYPDYPCLVYGPNILSTPYAKCDLYTYTTNPAYRSDAGVSYINVYGIETIPPNSFITFQFPKLKRVNWNSPASLNFSILEDTYGYETHYIGLYSQQLDLQSSSYIGSTVFGYTPTSVTVTNSDSVVNNVGDITLNNIDLGVSGCDYIIFEVDQTNFPDIGRAEMFTCGSHKCSKFNKPIQYFILYPQTTLARFQNLVFPSILNPSKAGVYTFYLRVYKGYNMQKKISFGVTVTPDTLEAPVYSFASYETATQIFPNTKRFYEVSWTLKNTLAQQTSWIQITFNNFFTLSSTYCDLTTTAQPWDGKGIECQVWQGANKVLIQNMKQTSVGQTFTLIVQMTTSSGASSISPTVTMISYVSGNSKVDQFLNAPFSPASVTNTNLQTLTSFDFSKAYEFLKPIKKGYFGDLIVLYDSGLSQTNANSGRSLLLTFTSEFYPYSNDVNLPLQCRINGVRYPCSYTLNPFAVTITGMGSGSLNAANSSVVNITTNYLERNGIHFPANQGRYLFKAQLRNSVGTLIENSQQFIDIAPEKIQYFNMSYAHRDANRDNIYIAEFQNGPTPISAYNDATNASRIYIEFPQVNADGSGTVFTSNLGFSNGTIVPCHFDTGADFITPISGTKLECRLRRSALTSVPVSVEIINFDAIGAFKKMRVFMAKIRNPVNKIMDMNFNLKINYYNPSTYQEHPHYENEYNLFIDMLDASVSTPTNADRTSQMFEPGTKVGDANKYINHIPYNASGGYSQNDWFIVVMNEEFQLNGVVNNCILNFYKRCIVFKQINWVAIHINNGTLIPFYPQITQMPLSISRVDTQYVCYSWKSQRWTETIKYIISASDRWMELRGAITNFDFKVLGSQNKLNINQKNVDVMISFTVSHKVPAKGTIEIQFPNNATRVPSIKPHCRSAVSMGSQLYGQNTGKPTTNRQGQIGCLVQNSYSWLITSYDELPANSNVMISGVIDFPTVLTSTLGTGYVITYTNEHSSNVFANGRIVDYLSTNFPLQVENKTWNLVEETSLVKSEPLRVNHIGKFEFKLQMQDQIEKLDTYYTGYIDINFWRSTILGNPGGFSMPSGSSVCTIIHETTRQKFACLVESVTQETKFITYRLKFYYEVAANTPYLVTISTQKGDSNEGISWPSVVGTYKIQTQIKYYTNRSSPSAPQVSKAQFIEVYGPRFSALNLVSSISIPGQPNLLLFEIVPSSNITNNNHRIVIQIPTISNDNVNLFDEDLGMGYQNNDNLAFDLYDSSISSMKCKVYLGNRISLQPTRIICNQYNVNNITVSNVVRFAFWVRNPDTNEALGIPIQVYVQQTSTNRKLQWQMLEAGIKVIPTSVSPVNDFGNFHSDTPFRQVKDTKFRFTNRNTKPLQAGDYYILKFNFDLRKSDKQTSAFKYPFSSYTNNGDAIFLRNSQTILLKVGATALANFIAVDAAQSNKHNVLLDNVIYNPPTRLTTTESEITAYAVYMATEQCEKIIHKDSFPTLSPYEPTTPDFTMTAINSNLRKGQYEDYRFTFRMNNDILTDAALVKKISIQFPADTLYDFKFRGSSCIEDPSTTIEIKKCTIDTSTYTIWIDPLVKSNYINSNYIIFQTIGRAIINPVSKLGSLNRIYLNNFVIKYYTWANDDNPPAIFATSDDFCFMKQDSSRLSNTAYLTYTSTTVGHHEFAEISEEVYVNEFLPLSTDIGGSSNRVRVPLAFKFIAPTAFANRDGTASFHVIKVNYGNTYSVPATTRINDLQRLIPTCELNGYRILNCNIDTTSQEVSMNFQQAISAGQQVSVRFSVLDPVDSATDGFITANTDSPMLTLPVYITPSGGSNYYVEAEPFPTYYKSSGITYPSMGISSANVSIGTKVFGKMNYLDFVIQFSRSDVNGLILEIPLVQLDGSIIYSDSKLLNLQSGAEYPCSVGHGMNVFCHYERGQTKNYGKPTRIFISRWVMPASNTLSFRMMFTNPDVINVFPTFTFKAFGGTIENTKFMGEEFMGEFSIQNAFKTLPATPTYFGTSTCLFYPTRRLYSTSTNVQFYINNDITAPVGAYVMLEWPLHDSQYGEVSMYQVYNNTYDYDYFIINYAKNNSKLYIVKKIESWEGNSTSHHDFGYLRNKHFLVNTATIYYFETPGLSVYSCSLTHSWHNTNRDTNQFSIAIQYLDLQDRISGGWGWQHLSIDLSSSNPSSFNSWLNSSDPGDMVVVVKWIDNLTYSALSANENDCSLEGGLRNTNLLKPITCRINSTNNEIVFKNVNKFSSRYLKFYYYAQTVGNDTSNHQVQVRVYANDDAYTSNSWEIWTASTPSYTMNGILLAVDNQYSRNLTTLAEDNSWSPRYIWKDTFDGGSVKITALSSSSITIAATKGSSFYQSNVYKMSFRFYMQRLSFSGGCSVSVSSGVPRSGGSCVASGNSLILNYSYYSSSNSHDWPQWTAGTTYTWTFSVSVSGELNADYMFVTMAYSWFRSVFYTNSAQCGTPGCPCSTSTCNAGSTLDGQPSTFCCGNCGPSWDRYCCCTEYYSNRYCKYWDCRWFWGYGGQIISGRSNTPYFNSQNFVSSYSGELISYQKNVETQLMVHFSNFQRAVGPSQQSFIMFQFDSMSFTNNNPFPYTSTTQYVAQIDCKCVIATGAMSITSSTTYSSPKCYRYLPSLTDNTMDASVSISINVNAGQDLRCYFPGFRTTSSNTHNIDIFLEENNYIKTDIPRKYWAKFSQYNGIDVAMNTHNIPYGINFDDIQHQTWQNNFWTSGQTTSNRYYQLNFSMSQNEGYPEVYMSMYAPVPVYEFCTTTSWSFCRFYDSFINRRFFFVAKSTSSSISSFRISGTSKYPPSIDASTSFHNTLLYVTRPSGSRYLYSHVNARTSSPNLASIVRPQTNSKSIQPAMFGNFLETYNSSIIVSVYLPGRTIYSVDRGYGQYRGSFIKVSFTGLTNLRGCSATLRNRPINLDAPFYCQVKPNSQINIFSRIDLTITDFIYFTVYTSGLPATSTYTVELFEKFISTSDYARSFSISDTYSRSRGGYSTMDPTQIQWRRPFYKEYRTASGPVRFKFRNNLQYVSDYPALVETANTNAIIVYMPSGFSSSDTYVCFAKEYLPEKESLFRRIQLPCGFWSYGGGNKVHIKPLPAYILKPAYFYEFAVYRHTNTSTMLITLPTADVFSMEILTSSVINSESVTFYDYFDFYKYKNVYPCTLNSIYTLTREAAANNSLFLDFTLSINGTNFNYFEFQISALGLSNFKIENGDEIPCFLSSQFTTVSGKTQAPRCYGFTNQIGADSPLVIRVFGMASWATLGGTNFKLSFDNFNNPAVQRLFLVPIDITFRYIDRHNRRQYQSNWPSVYLSDSINIGSPTEISGSLSRNNNNRGQNTNHFISIGWPYTSSSDSSQKVVLKLAGGVLCCQPFSSINLRDNHNSYTLLWRNTMANISVYLTPSYNVGWGRELWINNVNNPYPYQRDTYERLKKIQILFYNNWRAVFSKKLDQFDYSTYHRYDEMTIDASPSLLDSTKSYYFHEEYPLTYRFTFSTIRNEFNNRQLSYTIVTFSSAITWIDWVHAGSTTSSDYFNSLLQVTIGRAANNNYLVNISGMSESTYSTSHNWQLEMRFFTTSDTISYTSQTFNLNGELEFTNSRTLTISSSTFRTSPQAPTAFELREKKYFKNYYELQRIPIYAKPSASTSKLEFRFTTPYSIINQETIDFILPDTSELYPINSPSTIYCLIRKTITSNLETGISKWAACTYSAGTYRVTNPIGNLLADIEYTLTILERNQTTSTFKLPYTPKRIEVPQIYRSQLNLMYGDVYDLDFEGRMNSISWTHASLAVNQRNMIGINFNPEFTLSAASLVNPITEAMLELEIYSKAFDSCIGAGAIFSNDNAYFASGTYYSHFSNPAVENANTRLKCGQFSQSYAPIKLTTTDYGQVLANTNYYFRYPLILNPNDDFVPFIYRFRLIQYPNNAYYPVIVASYEYEGLQDTMNGNTYGQTGTVLSTNNWVQSTVGLSYRWPSFNLGVGFQTWLKWENDQIEAFTDISSLKTITTADYHYEYYPNINLCVYIKANSLDTRTVSLGNFPTRDDIRVFKVSWIHIVYTNKYQREQQTNLAYSTNDRTSWDFSQFTLLSGLRSTNSQGLFRVTWRSSFLKFVQGTYMRITFQNSPFSIMDEYCQKMTGFYQGTTLSHSNLICRRTASTVLTIEGYQTINPGATLSFDIYLKVTSSSITTYNSIRAYIQVFSQDDKAIIQANTANLASYSVSQGAQNLKLENAMRYKFMKDTARELFVQFRLASNTLGINQYVEIDFGDWQMDSSETGKIIASYRVGSNYYYTPCVLTKVSGNNYRFGVYRNVSTYSMTVNQVITLKIDHINPDNFYGILIPNTMWNYIKITAHSSAGVVIQHQFAQIWVQPYEHISLDVQPALDYVNAVGIYEFSVTPNVSVAAGDYIQIQFTTGDGLYSNLFATNLGKPIPTNSTFELSCRETGNAMVISNSNIKCELFKGDISVSPNKPTTIQIKVEKNIAANQLISFNILNLRNPARQNYPIGVTFKLNSVCYQQDINRLCNYYKSTKYMSFKVAAAVPVPTGNFGTLTFNPNIVSATNSKHTFGAGLALNIGDFVKILYYPEVTVEESCSLEGTTGVCYSYPLENTIIIKATMAQTSPFTFTLNGMTNLYQFSGTALQTEIWRVSTKTISNIFSTGYTVPIITTDPGSGNALEIKFTPTLTPNYQLSYNFDNIAKVQISYLLQNQRVKQILLQAPLGISLNSKYCNATLESDATEAKPYPFRLKCQVNIATQEVRITQNSDFPAWTSAFINKKVIVYLMYTIDQSLKGLSCANWVATTYTHQTSVDTNLRVSQAVGNFSVELYQSPNIYKVDFFTFSFTKRICETGEQCMFYGYLLPTTPQASFQIKYMDYTIPPQFKYSNLVSYDMCDMKEKNSEDYDFDCTATRNNSRVTIRFMPQNSYPYNHNYKLLRIDHSNATRLFTAPQYPGTHYQMKVDLYTDTHRLIESQYINLTTVYGKLLSWNEIDIKIPQDAETVGVFEFTFQVGGSDVEPAYESSSTNRITSAIEVIFSNSFSNDLGTGKKAGQEVACLPILNLNLNTMGKLTCRIYPSTSTITNPTIIVTGYDKILKGQLVTFMVAGLKSLPESIEDYIKIGVSYTYFDYGNVKGYLYEPTGKVVGPVDSRNPTKNIGVTVTEISSNIVGELVNYSFTCTFATGFAPVTPDDFVAIQFPEHGFEGRFNLNPKAKCSPANSERCYSFGLANVIYFKPAATISSTTFTFTLRDTINTAFAFDYRNMEIKIFTVIGGKIDSLGTGTVVKFSRPSLNISGLVTKSDSIYGGESQISYYVDFRLGTYLPEFGKISITFPNVYASLFDLEVSCNFTDDTLRRMSDESFCTVVSNNQLIIAPNGILLDKDTTYSIVIYNLTNPNANISINRFTIQSFYSPDIYNRQIISQNTFSPPEISVLLVRSCQFDLTVETKNQNYRSFYSMALICPSVIKEASRLQVFLPWNLTNSSKQLCTSQSNSLYSYECNIKNEFINNRLTSFMEIYLKEHVPQKLISLKGEITNGIKGSYTLNASISFKGFTYLVATSNRILIDDTNVKQLDRMQVIIQNYPYNRKYQSVYTFKITNPKISANSIRIDLPSVITIGPNGIQCHSELSNTNKDYFMLLTLKNATELSCSMDGQSILINGILPIIQSLRDDEFLFLDVFGLRNPEISRTKSQFKFTFLNLTDSTGLVIGSLVENLAYKVSQPPLNMQMNTIMLSTQKFEVINNYTLISSTIANTLINITAKSDIGVKIVFPLQYNTIWKITPQPSNIKVYLSSTLYTAVDINMVDRILMAKFSVDTFVSFSQLKVVFEFRNPSTNINCTISNFVVSLFDFKQNSVVAETVGNNVACLQFSGKLFWIKVSGNPQIRSGNFSVYTIELQRPAKYLKITPVTTSSAITFSPAQITFENYGPTIQQFRIVSSPAFMGRFLITFTKEQMVGDLFYNDIKNETVSLVAPITPFMINFEQNSVKSVGEPIQSFINIQVPSTVAFALLHSNNCSSEYDITPVGRITIPPGASQVSFSIRYKGDVIPYMCAIKFEISSLTNINYALASNVLYLSGQPSIDRTNSLRPMILRITRQPRDSRDVGTSILTKDSKLTLKPIVYQLREKTSKANWVQLEITTSEPGFIYYAAMETGTEQDKVTQKMIFNQNIKTGLAYNRTRAVISSLGNVNIITSLILTGLESDKRYLIGAYVNSTVGLSDIKFYEVQTLKSSNGAVIKICFNSIQLNATVLSTVSKVLRIRPDRLSVFTFKENLLDSSNSHSNAVMNSRRYVYELVLAPNRFNDSITPMDSFNELIGSKDLQQKIKASISSFDLTYTMTAHELILAKPKVRGSGIKVEQLTYQNIRVSVEFWEVAYVYGIIVTADSSRPALQTQQIINGVNRQNIKVNSTHRIATQTNEKGVATLQFRLLSQQTDYEIFVTAECVLPYNPRAQLLDSQVLKQSVKTTANLNVPNNGERIIEQLKEMKNFKLAQAVREHLLSIEQKKVLNQKVKKIRIRK